MSVLEELDADTLANSMSQISSRDLISRMFWNWFFANQERSVAIRIWRIRGTVRVKNIRGIFELLFGPANVTAT
jgi:DNA-binding response OmpR family regulator